MTVLPAAARQGLPPVLDEWLFPPDGSKRDLASLQVSLGHNDEFFAFDQYERISHINTELRDSSNSLNQKIRQKELARLSEELVIRRKSHTISFADDARDDDQQRSSIGPGGLKKKIRPMSIAISGVSFLASSHERKKSQSNQASRVLPVVVDEEKCRSSPVQRPVYSDAGVQTDVIDHDDRDAESMASNELLAEQRRSQVASDFSWSSLLSGKPQRLPVDTMSLSDTSQSPAYPRNPICLGGMNRYFRERQYRLGDSLIRRPSFGIGAY